MAGAPPPPWAVPPAAQALPRRAGEQLYNAVSGMSPAAWGDPAQLGSMLARCEALLCALHGSPSLAAYVERMAGGGGGQGPCTHVWTAGTIAYRCPCGRGVVGSASLVERACVPACPC